MKALRPGIRAKLLSFSSLVIVLIVVLELVAHSAASRSGREFEARIGQYHAVHRMRVALSEHLAIVERYLREVDSSALAEWRSRSEELGRMAEGIEPIGEESMDALFLVRAARRGVQAYLPLADSSVAMRQGGLDGYYLDFARADKIAGYVDGYLTKLLSSAMEAGEAGSRAAASRALALRNFSLTGVLVAGFVSLLFAVLFSASISAPIRRLARAAGMMASGKLEVEPVIAKSGDEVEVLADSFNSMSRNILRLVEGLKEKADLERLLHEEELSLVSMGKALREAQLMNLQDQMRPHFLFNALNAISRQAGSEKAHVSEGMARGLGRLLRYAIASEGSFASLEDEIGIVTEYLSFQRIRFGERLVWKVDVDPCARAVQIPRFTLQPVVENAVRHGIEPKVEGGRVIVSARCAMGRVKIRICDSGVGMDASLARTLRGALDSSLMPDPARNIVPGEGGAGIGLANLKSRLAFRYGDRASIGIASRPGRGTIIRISIPEKGA